MSIEQEREQALSELIEAKGAYSTACSEVQKIIKRYPFEDMRSPDIIAELAVKRYLQGLAQKRRMRANAKWLTLKPPERIEKQKAKIGEETSWFKEIADAAKANRPEFFLEIEGEKKDGLDE